MTIGVGGASMDTVLDALEPMREGIEPISNAEREQRQQHAQKLMREQGIDALYLDASASLYYFTGVRFSASERLHGAVLPAAGDLVYVTPAFEEEKTRAQLVMGDDIRTWEEHESPTALVIDTLRSLGSQSGTIAIDETTPFFVFDGLRRAGNSFEFVNGDLVTAACRRCKSAAEIALMGHAKRITLAAQKAAASILREGITTTEVSSFLAQAHAKLGADGPPTFCIVLFGEATAYPHGVPYPQTLKDGDMVLIDVGAPVEGYHSDITRSYVFGEPTTRQRAVWNLEQAAQAAAFDAAIPGATCESVDAAARKVIEAGGFGPGYAVPGLPHRTGHGIGLDVHEWTYLVPGNKTPLETGMCFSNEPMICIYGEFGVRLEDHFYMTDSTANWFTQPSPSVDDPFGYEIA
ncbi:MAG: X-Pro dipeptidase [Thiotrichales bacterium]|nr:X-Pro dipeptidase [Thiotrichales bacterium]